MRLNILGLCITVARETAPIVVAETQSIVPAPDTSVVEIAHKIAHAYRAARRSRGWVNSWRDDDTCSSEEAIDKINKIGQSSR